MKIKVESTAERTHSELGGSNAYRWANCPGSVLLIRTLPPQPVNEAAKAGTRAHELAEVLLKDFLEFKRSGADPDIRFSLMSRGYPPEMAEAAQEYKRYVWREILEECVTGKAFDFEDHLSLDDNLHMAGYVDFWTVYKNDKGQRVGAVVDFKFGVHPVEADKNSQLAFYGAALRKYLQSRGKDLDLVRGAIIQPRSLDKEVYKECQFTATQLDAWVKKFFKAAEQIYIVKKPKYKVGDWCRFCPAQAVCPKYSKDLERTTALALIDIDEIKLPVPETLTDEQLCKIVLAQPAIEAFLKACKTFVTNRHLAGQKVKGLKLVPGVARRHWLEDEEAVSKALIQLGVKDPWNRKLKGLGEIEDILSKTMPKAKVKEKLATITQKNEPRPTLVSVFDKRPELVDAVGMLEEISEKDLLD